MNSKIINCQDSTDQHTDNCKYVYTICKIHLTDLAKGVFTNKKLLYKAIIDITKNSNVLTFSGIIKYENKKVNYKNVLNLLNVLLVNESFYINSVDKYDKIHIYEIKKFNLNVLTAF